MHGWQIWLRRHRLIRKQIDVKITEDEITVNKHLRYRAIKTIWNRL